MGDYINPILTVSTNTAVLGVEGAGLRTDEREADCLKLVRRELIKRQVLPLWPNRG